jgi:hypothetical protein
MKIIKKQLLLYLFLMCSPRITTSALILFILLTSFTYYHGDTIVATNSYEQGPPQHHVKEEINPKYQNRHIFHVMSVYNSSVKTRITSEHKAYDISALKFNYTSQSTKYHKSKSHIPYIQVQKFWNNDPLNVFIDINFDTYKMSSKYLSDVERAIDLWSNLLKSYSGNYSSWNFNVTTYLKKPVHSAIIIKLSGDPLGQICNDSKVRTYAITFFPSANDQNSYLNIPTSCLVGGQEQAVSHQEIYSTVLHEFGHALGLGHAHNLNGDLMCSTELTNQPSVTCEPYSVLNVKPSKFDINALLYIYGTDGFKEPNNRLFDGD